MKQVLLLLTAAILVTNTEAQSIFDKAKKVVSGNSSNVTEAEAGGGVKEALNNGINSPVSFFE